MSALLVGVDIGTTLTKAGLVDLEGRELGCAVAPTVWQRVTTGAEAAAEDFASSAFVAVAKLLESAPSGEIVGVGVTSVAETLAVLDGDGVALWPAIAWHDTRAEADHRALSAEFGADALGRRTGLGTSQIPSIATLRWLADHTTDARRATVALSVAEWVVRRLGGDTAAEASLASRTGALSVATRQWWPEMLAWAGLSETLFPEVRTAGASWGRVHTDIAGLARIEGARLTVGGHDHLCASVGIGIVDSSQAMDSCGTAEAVLRPVEVATHQDLAASLAEGISTGCHVLPGYYSLVGGRSLGLDLMAVLERLGATTTRGRTDLDAEALEYERPRSERAQQWYDAVVRNVEGALALLESLERIAGPIAEVRVSGGWAHNPVLEHLKATAFPSPIYPQVQEAGVRGAALLAGQAAGIYASAADFPGCDLWPQPGSERVPTRKRQSA